MRTPIKEWLASRLPTDWKVKDLEVAADQDEVVVVADLPGDGSDPSEIRRFRESTREERMVIAGELEQRFGRKVSWGARCGPTVVLFTTASVPVMTRLRMPERKVLDTLIDAGIARSRSEALAWCVKLVGDNEAEWIGDLRRAFQAVEATRAKGPRSRRATPD